MKEITILLTLTLLLTGLTGCMNVEDDRKTSSPGTLTATDGTHYDRVVVTWGAVVNATSYAVYRSSTESGSYTLLTSVTTNRYEDTAATAGTNWYYKIKATGPDGESDFSTTDAGNKFLTWSKTFAFTHFTNNLLQVIISDQNGNYLCAGKVTDNANYINSSYGVIFRLNTSGAIIASNILTSVAGSWYRDITQTSDGNIFTTGSLAGSSGIMITKFDSDLSYSWHIIHNASDKEEGRGITTKNDDSLIAAGTSQKNSTMDAIIMQMDKGDGSTNWIEYRKDSIGNEYFYDCHNTTDGGVIVCGELGITSPETNIRVIKYNSDNTTDWIYTADHGNGNYDRLDAIIPTSDGGYIGTGYRKVSATDKDLIVIKLSSTGSNEWAQIFGDSGFECGFGIAESSTDGYYVLGYTTSKGSGGYDTWLLKLDTAGNLEWDKTYGGSGDDRPSKTLITTQDGGILFGYSPDGNTAMRIIKADANGNFEE